jgi:hypothetical protein
MYFHGNVHTLFAETIRRLPFVLVALTPLACREGVGPKDTNAPQQISTDAQLYELVTQTAPFSAYPLFPRVDSVTIGTLNGSTAHRPLVRVRMNPAAFSILQDGRLPTGAMFPDGSILLKEIISGGTTTLYAMIYKDRTNPLAASGWLWAEYQPGGTVVFSISERGSGCVSCHMREQGPQHDFVRTFERQQ